MAERVDRMLRVNELIKRELGMLIQRDSIAPDGMLLSVKISFFFEKKKQKTFILVSYLAIILASSLGSAVWILSLVSVEKKKQKTFTLVILFSCYS